MIDIIIVNYQSTACLLKCIESIYTHIGNIPISIYVQDNASDDNPDIIKKQFPKVHFSRNLRNIGFAAAVNNALKISKKPYAVLLNPDTIIKDNFFNSVLEYMEMHPDVGILGPKIFDDDGTVQGSARSFPTPLTSLFGRKSPLTRIFPNNSITASNILTINSDGKSPIEVDWVSGACMVIRRDAVDKVGLLDERFFMYWEDADWCKRMKAGGWKVVYFPKAEISHSVGKSSNSRPLLSICNFHISSYLLFSKYAQRPKTLLKPFAASGLFFRCVCVIGINLINNRLKAVETVPVLVDKFRPAKIHGEKNRIKILRVISRLNIGGPSIHVHLLTNNLNHKQFITKLVTGKISPFEGDMSYLIKDNEKLPIIIPQLQREVNIVNDLTSLYKFYKLILKYKPDIVHTHTAKAGSVARTSVFIYNLFHEKHIYLVHTFHGNIFQGYFKKITAKVYLLIERLLAEYTDQIIAISESQKNELVNKFNIARSKKVKILKLGFDLRPFTETIKYHGDLRKKYNIEGKTFLIGIIGRLVPIKNHILFLKAARIFISNNPELDVKFLIIGDGELKDKLSFFTEKAGLKKFVIFCGWIKNISKIYTELDLLALTSINEGTPVSIIEAMAASIPVIATNAGGVKDLLGKDYINHNQHINICERGVICCDYEAESLANGFEYIKKENKVELNKRVKAARDFVLKNYSKERLIRETEGLYLELINSRA